MSLEKLRNKIEDNYLKLHFYKLSLTDISDGDVLKFPTIAVPHPLSKKADRTWRKCSKKETRETLRSLLRTSLAYNSRITGKAKSIDPDEILNLFSDDDYQIFDNGNADNSWSPLTSATFDRGILFLGKINAGIFLVEDED